MTTKKPAKKDKFTYEYEKIIGKEVNTNLSTKREWKKTGDFFEKFSLYENYTPVKTSGSTTLITK